MAAGFLIFAIVFFESPAAIPWGGTDFVQYYATARLLHQGQNPYDLELSSQIQIQLGRGQGEPRTALSVLPTYGPPWCLLPGYLLGYLSFSDAVAVNLGINVVLLLTCTLAWTHLFFPEKKWLLPMMVVCIPIWLPMWLVLGLGQNSLWPLAGFAGWLWFTTRQRLSPAVCRQCEWASGACLTLLVVKPHLGFLLGLFAGAFMLHQRQWRSILGFAVTLTLATMVTFLIRPSVWSEYLLALGTGQSPLQYCGATLDGWLRFNGGDEFRYLTWPIWLLGLLGGTLLGVKISHALPEIVTCSALLCTATLAIVPHAYSYDYVLMIPGFILTLGSWIMWRDWHRFITLMGWLLLVVFYATGKSHALQEQNFFIIPWSALALMMTFTPAQRMPMPGQASS
jgi:hypothetical protein